MMIDYTGVIKAKPDMDFEVFLMLTAPMAWGEEREEKSQSHGRALEGSDRTFLEAPMESVLEQPKCHVF